MVIVVVHKPQRVLAHFLQSWQNGFLLPALATTYGEIKHRPTGHFWYPHNAPEYGLEKSVSTASILLTTSNPLKVQVVGQDELLSAGLLHRETNLAPWFYKILYGWSCHKREYTYIRVIHHTGSCGIEWNGNRMGKNEHTDGGSEEGRINEESMETLIYWEIKGN